MVLAFAPASFLCTCLTCLCLRGFPILWIIRAPVLSFLGYPSICLCHTLPNLSPSPILVILVCLPPEMLASQTVAGTRVAYSGSIWGLSCTRLQDEALALNLAVCLLSLGPKEESKHPGGLLRVSGEDVTLPSFPSWTQRHGLHDAGLISTREAIIKAVPLQPGNQDAPEKVLAS